MDKTLYKYDQTGNKLWYVELPALAHAVCVDENDKVLVSVANKVYVYGEDGQLLSTFRRQHPQLDPWVFA